MNSLSTISKALSLIVLLSAQFVVSAQIYTFTSDSVGVYSIVAPNAAGSNMGRIHSATPPATACQYGFSSKNFPTTTTFATTLPADTMAVWATTGHLLAITGFSADIRRSATGPQNVRFAYSTDGGTTWVNQGTDQAPNNNSCDSMITATWSVPMIVTYTHKLEFAIFGFNATSTSGTFQVKNLKVNGIVATTAGVQPISNEESIINVYPNPVSENVNIAYYLSQDDIVNMSIYNVTGRQIPVVNNQLQNAGDHTITSNITAPGVYFVRLTVGNQVYNSKFVKL